MRLQAFHRLLVAILVLASALPARASAADAPRRLLFVGNSLTYTTDIPGRVANLAKAMGKQVTVESVAFPSFSLEDHWNDGRALEAIRKGWDVVVLQQGTSAHDEGRDQLVAYAKRFADPIRKAGAKPALYMVWPLADRPKDFNGTILAYRAAAEAVGGILIPAGEAWLRALSRQPRLKLYSDAIHPSSFGSDLATLAIYLSLFPAGPTEFTEAYVAKIASVLEIPDDRRDFFFDVVTRAIDEPLLVR